jgi:hypothetical protein
MQITTAKMVENRIIFPALTVALIAVLALAIWHVYGFHVHPVATH